MNVQLLPAALDDVAILRASGYRGAGFLLGATIGRFILVERLLPLDFDGKDGDAMYAIACEKYGERLQGIFFCRKPPFAIDAAIGAVVIAVGCRSMQAFNCEFAAARKKAGLRPLLEEVGENE